MRKKTKESDIFFGAEHRLRKEEVEEQFNKEAQEGRRVGAHAARITDEKASNEDRKHRTGGVFVAVDSNLGAVVGAEATIRMILGSSIRLVLSTTNTMSGYIKALIQ